MIHFLLYLEVLAKFWSPRVCEILEPTSLYVECDQAMKYIYALIHFLLYLEVLVKFWSPRISMQSIVRC